uniref:Uncharacterized protein n=1 Tax=Anopheles farauti TaxID=69004 RepID=A0A182Q0F3_9DIPT
MFHFRFASQPASQPGRSKCTTTEASDLFSMASSPALPLYASRYSTPNGYPQINGEVDAPLDFRKVESLRRYVAMARRARKHGSCETTNQPNARDPLDVR